jgi:hypothetical protein
VSAADAREELEAAINRQLTRAWKYGLDIDSSNRSCPADVILAAAYAAAQRGDMRPYGTIAAARRHRRYGEVPPGKKLRDVCPTCADAEVAEYRERTGRAA